MLLLDLEGDLLTLRLSGAGEEDLERLARIPVKKRAYIEQNGRQIASHWLSPYDDLAAIFEIWPEKERICTPAVDRLFARYQRELVPLDELAPFPDWVINSFVPYRPPLPHQSYIFSAAERYRTLDASDCGTGKGFSALYRARLFYNQDRADFRPEKLLIVTINAQVDGQDSWRSEVKKMYGVDPVIWLGTRKQRLKLVNAIEESPVVLCTYDLAQELDFLSFDSYIFDECDLFSNAETKTYKSLVDMFEDSFNRVDLQDFDAGCVEKPVQMLTGTPVGKHISSAWSILHLASPLRWGTYEYFCQRHEQKDKVIVTHQQEKRDDGSVKYNRVVKATRTTAINMDEFQRKFKATAFRVCGDSAMKFDKGIVLRDFDMTPDQQELYDEVAGDIISSFETLKAKVSWAATLKEARVQFLRLVQIGEGLFNLPGYENNLESAKLDYLIDTLLKADHKIIVWARFRRIVDLLHLMFKDKAVAWHGDVDKNGKILVKGAFNAPTGEALTQYIDLARQRNFPFGPGEAQFLFAVTERRSSRAMNLHGSCHHQIFSSIPLHAPTLTQTIGRVVRVGQEEDTITEFLRCRDTWEMTLLKYMLNQVKFSKSVLDGNEVSNKSELAKFLEILKSGQHGRAQRYTRWQLHT